MVKPALCPLGLALVLALTPVVASTEPPDSPASDLSWVLGARAWATTGYTKWSFEGPSPLGLTAKPLSELRWRGVDSIVPEVNGEVVWKRLVLMSSVGGGGIDEGVLIDDDFALSNHQGRFSHTRSDVNDRGLFYVNGDIGVRVLALPVAATSPPGYLDYFVGYQYWHEKYVAFGATGLLDLTPFGLPVVLTEGVPANVEVLTHEYLWQSLRVGLRTQFPLYSGLGLKARAIFLPWSSSDLQDVHHLRTDLKQNPSFTSHAEGGFGVQLDGALTYAVWRGLSIEAGYQYWGLDSGSGDKITRALTATVRDKLDKITIERYGPYLGLQYRF